MRVLLTHDALTQRHGGVSRYVLELARVLRAHDIDVMVLAGLHNNAYVTDATVTGLRVPAFRGRNRLNRGAVALLRNSGRFDLVHDTMPDRWPSRLRPRVVTIYDVITLEVPEQFDRAARRNEILAEWAHRADLVLTPTEATRQRLCELVGADPDTVRVTPFGVRAAASVEPHGTPGPPCFLYVGFRDGYKNFDVLLHALSRLPGDARLRCVGGGPLSHREELLAASLGVATRLDVRGHCSDHELDRFYRTASGLVSTSLYEGFGLPVVEAMARGCPVICSRIAPYEEVAGSAARYFDPRSPDELAAQLDEVRSGGRELGAPGVQQVAAYTWERTGALTAAAYRSVVPSE
jgi:glycosyltransferase involved in cell wall biosynthesis